MGKIHVIISGKGGVGKTTSAINLGSSINSLGKEVIIVDANLTTPNIGLHLGSPIVPTTLNHVMTDKAKVEEAIYEHESGTKILPSSLSLSEMKKIDHDKILDVSKKLRKLADHIIIDAAAGLGEEAKASIKAADEIIIITNPEMSAVTDALKTIKLAEEMKKPVIGCIVTRHDGTGLCMKMSTIEDMLEVPILGVIPEDRAIKESQIIKNAVIYTHPKAKSSKAYRKIARRLIGEEVIESSIEEDEGFFSRLLRNLGLK